MLEEEYTECDYQNSRLINYNRWSTAQEVDALVNEIGNLMTFREKGKYIINLRVILVDLYQAYIVDRTQYVSYFRGKGRYDFIPKYNPNHKISYTCFVGSIDFLAENGFIENKLGIQYDNGVHGKFNVISRMRAMDTLVALFEKHKLTPEMIGWFKYDVGLVVLKDIPEEKQVTIKTQNGEYSKTIKIKKEFDYDEDKRSNRIAGTMIRELVKYNKLLDMTYIDIDVECISDADKLKFKERHERKKDKDHVTHIDLSRKRVYRVFNNRSWNYGGRFYSGWWISTPGVLRKYIYINGEPTVELDFKGMHIHFLYAMKGISYAPLGEDPYELVKNDPNRELNKLLLLTAFNAANEDKAVYSTSDLIHDNDLEKYGLKKNTKCPKLRKILAALKVKHKDVADLICNEKVKDVGVKLQNIDSCVAAKVVNYFTNLNIPVLTVHDSIICAAQYEALVKDRMLKFYIEVVNSRMKMSLKHYSYEIAAQKLHQFKKPIIKNLSDDQSETSNIMYRIKNYSPVLGQVDYQPVNFLQNESSINVTKKSNEVSCSVECGFHKRKSAFQEFGKIIHYKRIDLESVLLN